MSFVTVATVVQQHDGVLKAGLGPQEIIAIGQTQITRKDVANGVGGVVVVRLKNQPERKENANLMESADCPLIIYHPKAHGTQRSSVLSKKVIWPAKSSSRCSIVSTWQSLESDQ